MKKKLLFAIDSLHCAGAEKSLVTLLSLLDYSKYTVDLMLFARGGALEELVPEEVNILPLPRYMTFGNLTLSKSLIYALKRFDYKMLCSRIRYSMKIRTGEYGNTQKARLFWQTAANVIEDNPKVYDMAISYAQGVPTFYVADKVKATKKFAWVNAIYKLRGKEREFQRTYYEKYNKVVTVSYSAQDTFAETFPEYSKKTDVIYDITNPDLIVDMAEMEVDYNEYFQGVKILTIGRFDYYKGYDIALAACKQLKEKGVNFKWYVLGTGPLQKEIEDFIQENNLEEHFILLGVKSNPYPFIKNADIYVQTSREEGFGLAIAEARMLNTPVVTTRFDAVYNQMIHEKNGLVADMNANAVYEGIMRLINDKELKLSIIEYLGKEKKGNLEEVEKFYQLIEESEQTHEEKSLIYDY